MLTQKIIEKEFALSGSEQNPDLTGKSVRQVLEPGSAAERRGRCRRSCDHGVDFVVERDLRRAGARG